MAKKFGNRKKAQDYILNIVKEADPTNRTFDKLTAIFKDMSDEQFHQMYEQVRDGKAFFPLLMDNHTGRIMDNGKALDLCEKHGVKIFQRIWYRSPATGVEMLSNHPVPVIHMPIRRQIETLQNKASYQENYDSTDQLTGQSTDAASALTQPETLVILSKGMGDVAVEFLKYRGGDVSGGREFDKRLVERGEVSTTELYQDVQTPTRVVETADIFLTGAHYETNLDPTKRNSG